MNNIFDRILHHFGKNGHSLNIVVVGAMDGVSFDESRGYIDMYNWNGLFIEPMPEMFNRLKKSFEGRPQEHKNKYEQSAITDKNGPIEMIYIPPEVVDGGLVHSCFNGMSAVYPPKNGLGSEGDRAIVEKYSKRIIVNGMTLSKCLKKHKIKDIDFISIDAEGHDYIIFKQLDIKKYRPKLIRLEFCNLSNTEKDAVTTLLKNNGYTFEIHGQNIDAAPEELIKSISENMTPVNPSTTFNRRQNDITFVTALYDIGRGDINQSFNRSFEHYKECFGKLLKHDHLKLVVFCDETLNEFVNSFNNKNVRIINRPLDNLVTNFPFFDKVQKIRTSPSWYEQAGWLKESTQAVLEYYNPLVMSKQFFLNDASIFNLHNTNYFCWIDAGLYNTVQLNNYLDHSQYYDFEKKLKTKLNRMLYICFPYDGQAEVHGFTKGGMNRYAGHNTEYVARGGFFGGTKETINHINDIYYHLLNDTLSSGEMGTEESIFTLITYKHPELCNIHMIKADGLVYKFFEDVKHLEITKSEISDTAFYFLTYNSPLQFEYTMRTWFSAYPEEMRTNKKYVVDNSTNENDALEYKKMFEKYDIELIKSGENLGICGGRLFVAEHFNQSDHDYYVFIEEDMGARQPNSGLDRCGFQTYHKGVLNKAKLIINKHDLDFLKLSFDEFFGNNFKDWASVNVPPPKRDEYFPQINGERKDRTKVEYWDQYEGLPYYTGHAFYCNWPILFTKAGNYKVFLETKWAHPYEQTWMSHVKTLLVEEKIKSGGLLASIILHDRKWHYDGKTRKEN